MWSPWRSKHIDNITQPAVESGSGDLFERLAASTDDAENLILWRGARIFVVMNLYPYNNGHLLIVPYRKVSRYEDLTTEEQVDFAAAIERCILWLGAALHPEGYNVGMNLGEAAGAGVPEHLHVHVVPRWSGDTNFMPTTADVKIIPEAMQDTYKKLRAAVEAEERREGSHR